MAKIKNWNKLDEGVWLNTATKEELMIAPSWDNSYIVLSKSSVENDFSSFDNAVKTYKEANQIAVDYMKRRVR